MELVNDKVLKQKKFVIVPGFLHQEGDTESYTDLIKAKLLTYEVESKFSIDFLLQKDSAEIESYFKSIKGPFIILLLREVSPNNFKLFEKIAKKNKNCLVYYEGKKESLAYFEGEKTTKRIIFFEERLELFLMLTKKELDALAQQVLETEKIES